MAFLILAGLCLVSAGTTIHFLVQDWGLKSVCFLLSSLGAGFTLLVALLNRYPFLTNSVAIEEFFTTRKIRLSAVSIGLLTTGILGWHTYILPERRLDSTSPTPIPEVAPVPEREQPLPPPAKPRIRLAISPLRFQGEVPKQEMPSFDSHQKMEESFSRCADIEIVARERDSIKLMEEIELVQKVEQQFNPKQVAHMGKRVGASHMVLNVASSRGKKITLWSGLYEIERGTLVTKQSQETLAEGIDVAAKSLSEKILAHLIDVQMNLEQQPHPPPQILLSASGTVSCLPEGWHLWITMKPPGLKRGVFLQGPATMSLEKGKWNGPNIFLGEEGKPIPIGSSFEINAMPANPVLHQELSDWFKKQEGTGKYKPFELKEEIPVKDVTYKVTAGGPRTSNSQNGGPPVTAARTPTNPPAPPESASPPASQTPPRTCLPPPAAPSPQTAVTLPPHPNG